MKKIFFCLAVSSLLASCSSNDEPIEQINELVPAVIKISNGDQDLTRAYLGFRNTSTTTSVPVTFEKGDAIIVDDGTEHEFTVEGDGVNTSMKGSWRNPAIAQTCYAVYGHFQENVAKISFNETTGGTWIDENGVQHADNTIQSTLVMHFDLPNTQQTLNLKTNNVGGQDEGVSCQRNALLAFAYPIMKGITMQFIPVVSYLYFTSTKEHCKIQSNQEISGPLNVNFIGPVATNWSGYTTARELWRDNKLSYYATNYSIECTGTKVKSTDNYFTYLVAIKPDRAFTAVEGIQILVGKDGNGSGYETGTGFHNLREFGLAPNVVYNLGNVDPAPAGAPARDIEQTTLPFGR